MQSIAATTMVGCFGHYRDIEIEVAAMSGTGKIVCPEYGGMETGLNFTMTLS
jgi:hypothetical protein